MKQIPPVPSEFQKPNLWGFCEPLRKNFNDLIGGAVDLVVNSLTTPVISAGNINSRSLYSTSISSPTISGGNITGWSVVSPVISGGSFTSTSLYSNSITSPTISGGNITSNSLYCSSLATPTISGQNIRTDSIIFPAISGVGVKFDHTTPVFGWFDLEGVEYPDPAGADAPVLDTYVGGIRRHRYGAGKKMDYRAHWRHDYKLLSDVYLHLHISHLGTGITGNFTWTFEYQYAKGHGQATYGSTTKTITGSLSMNITAHPQYCHYIHEIPFSIAGGSATLLDTNLLEPDGLVIGTLTVTGIPTITGVTAPRNEIFIDRMDFHFQSTGIPTKNRAPNFYN